MLNFAGRKWTCSQTEMFQKREFDIFEVSLPSKGHGKNSDDAHWAILHIMDYLATLATLADFLESFQ